MTKKAIIYHDSCNDGMCSLCVTLEALKKESNDIVLIPAQYKKEELIFNRADLLKDREAVFLDFNLEPELMDRFMPLVKNTTVIDHHKTSLNNYNNYITHQKDGFTYLKYRENCSLILDMNRSGALMAWDYFNSKPAPKLVEYISDGDLYRFKDENTIPFLSRLSAEEKTLEKFQELLVAPDNVIQQYIKEGSLLAKQFNQICEGFLSKVTDIEIDINGKIYQGSIVPCGGDSSIRSRVGQLIYDKNNTFAALISKITDKEVEISFRSSNIEKNGEIYSILPIVSHFGGGGHETAGAIQISLEEYNTKFKFINKNLNNKIKLG